jgi:type IV pilus assembly protein PilY1
MNTLTCLSRWALCAFMLSGAFLANASPLEVSTPRQLVPPNITTTSNRPMVMLAASKDHSLFGPIYTDFEDVDGDGVIDTTFIPTFKYYGYFDSTKCYDYDAANGRFNPAALASIESTVVGLKTFERYTCPSTKSYWSGNFLNWSSMTRLDVVRKMLYGGTRSTDESGSTVLERAKLNRDAHSFVKYYRGTDIRDYTPFTTDALTKTTGSNPNVYAGLSICNTGKEDSTTASPNPPIMRMVKGNVRFWATVEVQVCRWRDDDGYTLGTFGPKLARYYQDADKGGGGIAHEVTIPSRSSDGASYDGIGPELTMRVKVCEPSLLGEERCQAFPPSSLTNYKPYGLFQEFGYASNGAARAEFGVITGSYDLNYTAGALRKNMGDFSDEINGETGIFCHSASSGCAASLPTPDGRATGQGAIKAFDAIILNDRNSNAYAGSGVPQTVPESTLSSWGNPIGEMLVQALQYYAYNGSTPTPSNPSSTGKDNARNAPVATWKDPLSNSNATRTALYGNSVCRPLNTLLLSSSATSFDGQAATPFTDLPNRARGDINAYTNKVGEIEGINNTLRSIGSVVGGYGDSCSAKTVGNLSDVTGICPEAPAMGGTYQVAGAALYGNTSKIRTITAPPADLIYVQNALKVKTLAASLTGGSPRIDIPVPGTDKLVYITPESVQAGGKVSAPLTFASISSSATHGAFIVTWNDILMGGDYDMDITGYLRYDLIAAGSGWDIKITTDIPGVCGGGAGTHGFSVIGVEDATNTNANGRYLTHQHYSAGKLSGMPQSSEYLCGDDAYRNRTSTLFTGKFADTVCNVTGDGNTGDPAMPRLVDYCTVKNVDYPVSMTFHMVGASNALIKDPLFYAAKYGAFVSSTKNGDNTYTDVALPTDVASWDSVKTDGTTGTDDVPDGYFLARRPELLEQQLRKALDSLAKTSNSAPAPVSNVLTEGSFKFVPRFDSTTVTGNIEAFKVLADGSYSTTPTWLAGNLLRDRTSGVGSLPGDNGNGRQIITNFQSATVGSSAMPFRWDSLSSDYKLMMTDSSTNRLTPDNAKIALEYIRGDQSRENASTGLRPRGNNMLGPIVNAGPWVQSPPSATFLESQFKGYADFAKAQLTRDKLLWVGANDGMLHAFCAEEKSGGSCSSAGREIFAYVPGMLANRLAEIPLQRGTPARTRLNNANFTRDAVEVQPNSTVWAYVDGSPYTADVKINIAKDSNNVETGTWKTYLFSSLGRGGRGLFALDVTNVGTLANGEGNANTIFKWQFTSDDDPDLGYVVNDIAINANTNQAMPVVRLNNGKFGIIVGNGYQSLTGKAALFILFVDGPATTAGLTNWTGQYMKIVADAGTGNGLISPSWVDRNNDGSADVVYAGDLKGNLWKFDLTSPNATNWKVAYTTTVGNEVVNRPLFTAQYTTTVNGNSTVIPLPITTAPEYVYPAFDGLIINFGTGNAFETGDFPKPSVQQRFYGVWDRPSFATTTTGTGPMVPASMTTLKQRNYVMDSGTGVVTATADVVTNGISTYNGINWTSQDGWYINLPGASEAVNFNPQLVASFLVFQTIRPKTTTENCFDAPNNTLYVIDPIVGVATRKALDVASNGTFNVGVPTNEQKFVVVTNKTSEPYTSKTCTGTINCRNGKTEAAGASQICKRLQWGSAEQNLCYNPLGRVQWREIPGLRTDQ